MTDWVWQKLMGGGGWTPGNYRTLPPVAEPIGAPDKLSMTFLQHVDNCPRAGYLYRKHRRGPSSHAMDRGSLFHKAAEALARALIDADEPQLPPEVAKAIVQETIAGNPQLVTRHEDKDDVRIMGFHWAQGTFFEPASIGGIEQHLELTLDDGTKVHGVVDLILLYPAKRHAVVIDYKTSFNVPAQRAFARSFQTKFYAVLLLWGKGPDDPVGLGHGIETVECVQMYPRYLHKDGLVSRSVTLEKSDLTDFKADVDTTVAVARRGFSEGLWPAVTSSHCDICPAARECPLPPALVPGFAENPLVPLEDRFAWRVEDDPVRAAELNFHLGKLKSGAQSGLRGYSKEHGPVYYGPIEPGMPGRVFGGVLRPSMSVKPVKIENGPKLEGKAALAWYLEEAAVRGEAFDLDACYEEKTPTRFEDRKHEPDDVGEEWDE